jgi:hypothetical protein
VYGSLQSYQAPTQFAVAPQLIAFFMQERYFVWHCRHVSGACSSSTAALDVCGSSSDPAHATKKGKKSQGDKQSVLGMPSDANRGGPVSRDRATPDRPRWIANGSPGSVGRWKSPIFPSLFVT